MDLIDRLLNCKGQRVILVVTGRKQRAYNQLMQQMSTIGLEHKGRSAQAGIEFEQPESNEKRGVFLFSLTDDEPEILRGRKFDVQIGDQSVERIADILVTVKTCIEPAAAEPVESE